MLWGYRAGDPRSWSRTARVVTRRCCPAARWLGSGPGASRRRASMSVGGDHSTRRSGAPNPGSSRQPWHGAGQASSVRCLAAEQALLPVRGLSWCRGQRAGLRRVLLERSVAGALPHDRQRELAHAETPEGGGGGRARTLPAARLQWDGTGMGARGRPGGGGALSDCVRLPSVPRSLPSTRRSLKWTRTPRRC